ncbi:shikimate dehydrogenase [Buchnera aphidicola]|uniref:Shikimate dehydrogenase (NADP(+)) n=2 Tax=Buchnera aphidicola TaxID=9 RepID=W0P4A3_BUCMP|nr:shikimate dehydrogenase [Buchnera aphidicola]AHG59908.1 Aroe [Buchnera aphidicola str. USDA (Myzus persicae)]AHG60488.1 Aroe [Buchnera aphidicola str. W106 (Myzus persicae)]AHG61061.1 Aroe [Buchnera aphidicola str. G002 (Myzus persicae)]AHG61633.1 Aroe [Buchnera aphidicola str. F009 (Myzus persicae)]WAI02854.1 MAG: shikimate dehydrogenase [Buchnera aphidicola (Myzus persicae)]
MFKYKKFNYALFGNPIDHSKSPQIHHFFSKQTGFFHIYTAVNVSFSDFAFVLCNFFKKNGQGANITAPFKEQAYLFSNKLTERAKIAQSVNTLKKIDDTCILGDNTDGIGLLSDLIRLNFIKRKYSILIIGAGGAVKGVIFPLLSFGCSIFISNRTFSNAQKLVFQFNKYGNINIFDQFSSQIKYFDLVINATSKNIEKKDNFVPLSFLSSNTFFYDMNYQKDNTPFINWCIKIGATFFSNGIGMLVFQAAHSFFLWHNKLPETDYIIDHLNKNFNI